MSLRSYKAPTDKVILDTNNTVEIRGFSSLMLSTLLQVHYEEMEVIFKAVSNIISVVDTGEDFALRAGEAVFDLIKAAPEVVGTVIGLAIADDNDGTLNELSEAAMGLPISLQVEIITAIAKLTMKDIGAIKKMFGELKEITGVVAQNVTEETQPVIKVPRRAKKLT